MDANTDPRDVLPVNRWTTKQEVRKQMWERQSWSTRYDLVTPTEDKLDQSLLFLTRDMGLDDALEPFRIFVSERALSLFNQVTWMGKEYVEALQEHRRRCASTPLRSSYRCECCGEKGSRRVRPEVRQLP
jgi:hypothetical protein